ncbi:MAG TPA: V-type ATP synthase subunit I, partial [Methanocorpusculum sp.]|nr:V-type ATP synthase subunit I [Methanocorpusculum sp.]
RSNAEAKIRECEQRIAELTPFALVPAELDVYRGYESLSVYAGYIEHDVEFEFPCEKYFSAKDKETGFITVFVEKIHAAEAEKILSDAGYSAVSLPTGSGSVQAAIDASTVALNAAKADAADAEKKVQEAKAKYADLLAACDEVLTCDVERAEAPLRFATTEEAFVLDGWVPFDDVEKIKAGLEQATGGKIYVTVDEENIDYDEVPVEYNNPVVGKPAEVLMDLYGRPKYRELDPTLILGIMFPILFGAIVGDVGYGLIYLVVSLLMHKFIMRLGGMGKRVMGLMYASSGMTIIFGLLYSEIFGLPMGWPALIFARHLPIGEPHVANILDLMLVCVAVGIVYIIVGRIFGMINHARMDHKGPHRTKAILSNLGWNLMLVGLLLVLFSAINLNEVLANANLIITIPYLSGVAGTIGLILGIVMLVVGGIFIFRDSALDLVEIPTNLLTHMLSFTRIAAIGLSSVAIAMVVNYLAGLFFIGPGLGNLAEGSPILGILLVVLGVLLIIVGHVLNALLGVLDGAINAARLHMVEFFMKFYNGGGITYKPFGLKRKFSEE